MSDARVAPQAFRSRARGRWAITSGLVFIALPAAGLLADDVATWQLIVGAAGTLVFGVLYARLMLEDFPLGDDLGAVSGEMVALAVLAVGLTLVGGTDWAVLWTFCAAVAGFRLPAPHGIRAAVVLALVGVGVGALAGDTDGNLVGQAIATVGVGMLVAGFRRLRIVDAEVARSRAEIERLAVADERLRISRDLHDLLGHSLSVVALKSELAERLLSADPEAAAQEMREVQEVARASLADVRGTVSGFRRPRLEAELDGARAALAAAGVAVEAPSSVPAGLPAEVEELLAWAVREGTTNVLRHAGARRVRIAVRHAAGGASAEVVDDGCGTAAGVDGSGLAGLRERAARLEGRVEAGPADGGFRLAVEVPA